MHFLLLLLLFAIAEARQPYFIPPAGWEIAQLNTKIGFIAKGTADFCPSIHVVTEEVDVSLKEYVKAVKELSLADNPSSKWLDLGKFPMKGGLGQLISISNDSPWGERNILQAILVVEETAYILTAAILKKDLPKFQAKILESLKSLTTIPDLWSPISDTAQQKAFQNLFSALGQAEEKEKEWQKFQAEVKSLSNLGLYWQSQALREGYSKIYKGAS